MSKFAQVIVFLILAAAILTFFSFLSAGVFMILMGNIHAFAASVPAISLAHSWSVTLPVGILIGGTVGAIQGFND